MTQLHILKPDLTVRSVEWVAPLKYKCPDFKDMYDLVGTDCLEHVNVLWQGQKRHMFVDENGLSKALKFNLRATRIYWNATLKRNKRTDLLYNDLSVPCGIGRDDLLAMKDSKSPLAILNHSVIVGTALLWEGEME